MLTETADREERRAPADESVVRERLIESFRGESGSAAERLLGTLSFDAPPTQLQLAEVIAHARLIRGSAAVADLNSLAAIAGHLERILKALHGRRLAWTATLSSTVRGAANELLDLIEASLPLGEADEQRARAAASELARYDVAPRRAESEMVIPIARLFHSDSGPHILFVPVTPQTEFEQQLRALAERGAPGGAVRTPPGRAPAGSPARAQRRTPTAPRGHELHALLGESASRIRSAFDAAGETVPIQQLLYSGPVALERARELARVIRARGPENSRELIPELIDLLDLAAAG